MDLWTLQDDLIRRSTSHVDQYYARAIYGAAACSVGILALSLVPETMACQFHASPRAYPPAGSGERARRTSDHGKAIAEHRRPQITSFIGFYPVENKKGRPLAALTPHTARFYLIVVTFDFFKMTSLVFDFGAQ